ncbi:unnamed protein product [Cylicocyclus nassatus]|uniref:Phlebovirus glycoprotein G2 fusion domain-containing protein n=1 Tax=Cylicocyclus nassatus TaxID=53992 RepID=A0AA36M7Z0_CYLNA|nr:unnamed protein product [Cylicocyclus nassatus]
MNLEEASGAKKRYSNSGVNEVTRLLGAHEMSAYAIALKHAHISLQAAKSRKGNGCSCGFPSTGCLAYRFYHGPESNKIFEIFQCSTSGLVAEIVTKNLTETEKEGEDVSIRIRGGEKGYRVYSKWEKYTFLPNCLHHCPRVNHTACTNREAYYHKRVLWNGELLIINSQINDSGIYYVGRMSQLSPCRRGVILLVSPRHWYNFLSGFFTIWETIYDFFNGDDDE